jgi:hypothetical protein
MAVNVWVALHGIVSADKPPHHPWPPVDTLVNAVLAGQVGLAPAPGLTAGEMGYASRVLYPAPGGRSSSVL